MTGHVSIRLASERVNHSVATSNELPRFYTPGEVISGMQDFMRGHGTYTEDDNLKSSVAGVMQKVNKLICIRPLKSRYVGEIGDVVVGRVLEVQQRRWKVDTNSRLDSILQLSSVNLPGGELRRRSVEDEQSMRKVLQEGDLISAEVQSVFSDGSLSLHTRSLKYGKLVQGTLVKVFPSLIKRRKNHFHNILGISIIIGNNGYIWISPREKESTENDDLENIEKAKLEPVSISIREIMARVKNCIAALVASKMMLDDTSILMAYEESLKYETAKEMLDPEAMLDIAFLTQHRLNYVTTE
ncbi:PREDICTED: exosome complex component RRP4 [Papilio xuthus]|uniref:Exosome complex component RRP4 n=1 Tax=Papilio xuthus TaxID=66420 RepID=A0A194PRD6_PAPXU|nr:PREDICTED: exosome complex component RRP4 [Papilio xuthus]KPI95518.1 Exosome complex component RRP4 [Papilio xuthus]